MPKTKLDHVSSRPLIDLEVFVLDCQTTGSTPEHGHLLELAWCRTSAAGTDKLKQNDIASSIARLPEGEKIPRRVSSLTGITEADFESSVPPEKIWKELIRAAESVAAEIDSESVPTVIHYARFEKPWLRRLHDEHTPGSRFPFTFICTHEISRRLFPGLPRRGLRAVAGYLGCVLSELKRAPTHVMATARIWSRIARLLHEEHGIDSPAKLAQWLGKPPPPRGKKVYPLSRNVRLNLPDSPGIYRMLSSDGNVLYLGKAASLRKRVNSYFTKQRKVPEKTLEMLSQVKDVNVEIAASPLEAALLECDEIKKLSPPYNIALRDRNRDVCFSSPDFSDFNTNPDDAHPLGPFPSRETFAALGFLVNAIDNSSEPSAQENLLSMPEEMLPDEDVFRKGYGIFLKTHRLKRKKGDTRQRLIGLGTSLWQQHLDELDLAAEEDDEEEPEDEETEKEEWEWTPERVARALQWNIIHAGQLMRRAWWFAHLSESVLAWHPRTANPGRRCILFIGKGGIAGTGEAENISILPVPPGLEKPAFERQSAIDFAAYDRLRVLTTELRRIVSEGKPVVLKIGREAVLDEGRLAGFLRWV
ncbi:MAG: GIY-YIG nuclease family protein [Planctomycetota bacterium]|jgi:DNA polymerase-3 subunit epsilon